MSIRGLLFAVICGLLIAGTGCNNCCSETLSRKEVSELERAASNGNVAAMMKLFNFYGGSDEPERGRVWLKRAADAGNSEAEMLMYSILNGDLDPEQRRLAIDYLHRSAKHGSVTAQGVLGRRFREGTGVPQDREKAKYWLRLAARARGVHSVDAVLDLCDMALEEGDLEQCRECLSLDTEAISAVNPGSNYAGQIEQQRKRITEYLESRPSVR